MILRILWLIIIEAVKRIIPLKTVIIEKKIENFKKFSQFHTPNFEKQNHQSLDVLVKSMAMEKVRYTGKHP